MEEGEDEAAKRTKSQRKKKFDTSPLFPAYSAALPHGTSRRVRERQKKGRKKKSRASYTLDSRLETSLARKTIRTLRSGFLCVPNIERTPEDRWFLSSQPNRVSNLSDGRKEAKTKKQEKRGGRRRIERREEEEDGERRRKRRGVIADSRRSSF